MKKVLATLSVLAFAFSLSAPAFAKRGNKSKETAATTETGKTHMKHSKKKSATKAVKQGQAATPATHK